jgi:GTPase
VTESSRRHQSRQRRRLTATEVDLGVVRQRALLVGTTYGTATVEEAEASLEELALLAETAGAEPVHTELQRRRTPDPATYIGKGKAEELRAAAQALDVDVVIFDDELTPAQQRNLEKMFAVDVVDRVALILDIFAQHATSQEGAVQVELAQLRYRLPRLRGRGLQLSQQGAGIGTRGPGETQLEVDRRRLLRRTQKLERDLLGLAATRVTQRKARKRRDVPHVALVGYTNAGKSTLLNRLTHAGVLVQDQLFSTLDPTVRRLHLPGGESVVLSDTVGFVRRLPHQLVEAFRSTLEEVVDADLLVHMVDASASDVEARIDAVDAVLREIHADDVPRLLVWNKADLADADALKILLNANPGSVAISAVVGTGLPVLLTAIGDRLRALARITEFVVPYERGDVLAALHRAGEVLVEVHGDNATRVRARLSDAAAGRFSEYATSTSD